MISKTVMGQKLFSAPGAPQKKTQTTCIPFLIRYALKIMIGVSLCVCGGVVRVILDS